ncbi:hypothetical protein ADK67_02175 [Saccharothrix sp. NRRL B-16348]|uniref:hypothetical protein n=1 Tax=Saccharothrix sp. NRRL B-16348 TaxID=1415542 RepID=UPI0006AF434B|nr:hypothetical protein [Saccharothrix sp. NRRL B-16348]KOX35253.1 hypothetical protein ADK67_02175 [Saccharothrix sp. NRRL B-16348]
MSPHGLRVVVVVVAVVVVGRRVVVVVGRAVVVVVTSDVVVAVVSVVVVVVLDDVDVVVVRPDELVLDDVEPVAVIVRFGCSLRLTTTMSPPVGSRPRGDWAVLPCAANRAATAAPIKAPKANRPEPPNAVSIPNDYRPHSIGSNPHGQLVPA